MRNLEKIGLLTTLLLVSTVGNAAFKTKYERLIAKADRYYSWFAYPKSIRYYEKAFEEQENFDPYAARQLARSYEQMNQPEQTAIWYGLLEEHEALTDEDKIAYSKILLQNGEDDRAKSIVASVNILSAERGALIQSLSEKGSFYRDSSAYELSEVAFNSDQNDFSPAYYEDGLVFVSNRKTKTLGQNTYYWDGTYFLDLFYTNLSGEQPEQLSGKINTAFHEGPAVFFDQDQKVIFTRNNFNLGEKGYSEEGVNHLNLYYAEKKKNGKWGKAEPMPFNSEEYSVGHPALSADGKTLYFASDMAGSIGKADLYRSEWINDVWSQPVNLGGVINTTEDELFPFLSTDNVLYFASQGHPGLGGLDIYRVDLNATELKVENMGYPVNTETDDFGLILRDLQGYLSSNRSGGLGKDDIYQLLIHQLLVEARMKDARTGEPLTGRIQVIDQLDSVLLDEVQRASVTDQFEVQRGRQLAVTAQTAGYDDQVLYFNTLDIPEEQTKYTIDVPMLQHSKKGDILIIHQPTDEDVVKLTDSVTVFQGTPEELEMAYKKRHITLDSIYEVSSIYYDFDKSAIRPDAAVQLKKLAGIMKSWPTLSVLLWSHTDSRGSFTYNDELAHRRAESARAYLENLGIAANRIFLDFSGEHQLVNNCGDGVDCPEPAHQNNRRTEISIKE